MIDQLGTQLEKKTIQIQKHAKGQLLQSQQIEEMLQQIQKLSKESRQHMRLFKAQEAIYQYGESVQFKPVFYFISQKMNISNFCQNQKETSKKFDISVVYLYTLQLMQENLGSKLDFVIDFTEASLFDIICTIMILLSVGDVVGQQGMNNVNKIFVLNPGFYVRLVVQKYMSYSESFEQILTSVHDKIVICDSIKKLQAYVPDCSIALPLETKRFIDSISMVY